MKQLSTSGMDHQGLIPNQGIWCYRCRTCNERKPMVQGPRRLPGHPGMAAKPLEWTDSSSTVTVTADWMGGKEINEDEERFVKHLDSTGPQMKILGVDEAPAPPPTATMGQTPTLDDQKFYEGPTPPASSARDDKSVPVYLAPLE
ncbi:hypothetical protein HAX54_028912 [Datura stramonium]|uniref:Uncharacterized protein n=1 Tax=Datura stramonium TaxID=4076 RepID=A0ABS8V4Y5_DATST|nr:hypothetical protein [Datura stramonium]